MLRIAGYARNVVNAHFFATCTVASVKCSSSFYYARGYSTARVRGSSTAPPSPYFDHWSTTGMLGVEGLRTKNDFVHFLTLAEQRILALLAFMKETRPSKKTLYVLDEISDTLCRLLDAGEAIRNLQPNADLREMAESVSSRMASIMFTLNSDTSLSDAVKVLLDESEVKRQNGEKSEMDEEDMFVALKHYREFTNSGVHLKGEATQQAIRLQEEISTLSMRFQQNINDAGSIRGESEPPFIVHNASDVIAQLPRSTVDAFLPFLDTTNNRLVIPSQYARSSDLQSTLLLYVLKPSSVRRDATVYDHTAAPSNLPILDAMLRKRLQFAQLTGHSSYADYMIKAPTTLAENPSYVEDMLKTFLKELKPTTEKEMNLMKDIKRKEERIKNKEDVTLYRWDRNFYMGTAKARVCRASGLDLKDYFPLGGVMDGLNHILSRAFSVQLERVEATEGELWHPSVQKCILRDFADGAKGDPLGVIYLDLFGRPNKFPAFAMFTIRCSRKIPGFLQQWREARAEEERRGLVGSKGSPHGECDRLLFEKEVDEESSIDQLPVIAMVGSLEASGSAATRGGIKAMAARAVGGLFGGNSNGKKDPTKAKAGKGSPSSPIQKGGRNEVGDIASLEFSNDVRLSHNQVETIFHEFGHVLHAVFSKTKYQAVSGTRAAVDYVEIPSTLMEKFAYDYRVVQLFAKRADTKMTIPKKIFDEFRASLALTAGLDAELQAIYSLLDLELHSDKVEKYAMEGQGKSGASHWTAKVMRNIESEHSSFPPVPGTHWPSRFGHLATYGGGYYSYMWCKLYALQIWSTLFAEDPLNNEAGTKLRRQLLEKGGAQDPRVLLHDLLGDDISFDYKKVIQQLKEV